MYISRAVTKVVHEGQNLAHQDQLVCIRHLEEPPSIEFRIEESLKTNLDCEVCMVQNLNSDRRNGFWPYGQPN